MGFPGHGSICNLIATPHWPFENNGFFNSSILDLGKNNEVFLISLLFLLHPPLTMFPWKQDKVLQYINFCSKNAIGLIFRGCFILQSCHLLLVAAQCSTMVEGRVSLNWGFFGGRAYMTSILKNHTTAYFQVRSYFRGKKVAGVVLSRRLYVE